MILNLALQSTVKLTVRWVESSQRIFQKTQQSAGMSIVSVFWDAREILEKGQTTNRQPLRGSSGAFEGRNRKQTIP